MKSDQLLRAILPDVLIDNFDVVDYQKTDTRFDIWLDEKKVLIREDKKNSNVISHGFGDIGLSRISPSVGVRLTFMFASANGLTRIPVRYSVMNGNCPNLTRLVLTPSSFLF
jgi:Leucine-rich repeat (LRR) protein